MTCCVRIKAGHTYGHEAQNVPTSQSRSDGLLESRGWEDLHDVACRPSLHAHHVTPHDLLACFRRRLGTHNDAADARNDDLTVFIQRILNDLGQRGQDLEAIRLLQLGGCGTGLRKLALGDAAKPSPASSMPKNPPSPAKRPAAFHGQRERQAADGD